MRSTRQRRRLRLRHPSSSRSISCIAGLLVIPAIIVSREVTRASTRGTALQLSRAQYPEIYATMTGRARTLGFVAHP